MNVRWRHADRTRMELGLKEKNFETKALPQGRGDTERVKRKRAPPLIFTIFPLWLCGSVAIHSRTDTECLPGALKMLSSV